MNISQEVREKIQLLSPGERIKHYLGMLTEKKITYPDYVNILKAIESVPYIPIVSQGSEIQRNTGKQRGAVVEARSGVDTLGRDEAHRTLTQDAFVTSLERIDSTSLSTAPNESVQQPKAHKAEVVETTSQKQRLLTLLADYEWHTTPQIQIAVYGANHLGVARIAPRVNDLRNEGHDIESRKVTQAIWEYRLVEKGMRWITENIMAG